MVASRAPDGQCLVARPVEIDEHPARDERRVECLRSVEALLLGDREEQLERPVQDRVVVRDGHRRRDPDPVVCAERGSLGPHPVVLDANVDPPLSRVERTARIALADHVQVRLEDDGRRTVPPGRRRHAHDHVSLRVCARVEPSGSRPGKDVFARRPLLLRGAGDASELEEALPEERRLEPGERVDAHRRSVSAAPTTSSAIPSSRGHENATCSTPNQP